MTDKELLLSKKDWTGDEAGKVLIENEINSYRQSLLKSDGKKVDPEKLLSPDDFRQIVDTIKEPDQIERYNLYVGFRNWIIQYRDMALMRYNHVYSEIDYLGHIVAVAIAMEDEDKHIERLPVIMTQKQYDELRAKGIDEQLASEGQRSVFALIGSAVNYFIDRLQREPKKVNPVRRIKKTYQMERVRSARVLQGLAEKGLKDPSKWDALAVGNLFECYPAMLDKADVEDAEYIAQAEDFNAEFPELLESVAKEIDRRFFEGLRGVGDLSIEEWRGVTFTMRELYDLDYFGIRERVESDAGVFGGNQRVLTNGVAVLKPSDLPEKSPLIDERGYYAEPDRLSHLRAKFGIEQFTPANADYLAKIEKLKLETTLIKDGYRYLFGYERALDLMADHIGIPDLAVFKMGAKNIASRIEELNKLFSRLDDRIQRANGRDRDEKLRVLREYFKPIWSKEYVIPENALAQAKTFLNDKEIFEFPNDMYISMFIYLSVEGSA